MRHTTKKNAAELSAEWRHNPERPGLLKPDLPIYQDTEIQLRRLSVHLGSEAALPR